MLADSVPLLIREDTGRIRTWYGAMTGSGTSSTMISLIPRRMTCFMLPADPLIAAVFARTPLEHAREVDDDLSVVAGGLELSILLQRIPDHDDVGMRHHFVERTAH